MVHVWVAGVSFRVRSAEGLCLGGSEGPSVDCAPRVEAQRTGGHLPRDIHGFLLRGDVRPPLSPLPSR